MDDIDLVITTGTDDEEARENAVTKIAYGDPQHMTQTGFAGKVSRLSVAGDTHTCRIGRIVV